jgi:hypothetical protein
MKTGGIYLPLIASLMLSLGTICSLKEYAPVRGDLTMVITFEKSLPLLVFSVATTFFAIALLN